MNNLNCLDDIIKSNLIVNIDVTDESSWLNWNTGLTLYSTIKWDKAISDNIQLNDFGITNFDIGLTNIMWDVLNITPSNTFFTLHRIGYNIVNNPSQYQYTGVSATTEYLPISANTFLNKNLNYFDLNGGFLQGFFKLEGFNYEVIPSRFGSGITIENVLYLKPESWGIFYLMGARAEDKYNLPFSGETITGKTPTEVTGITTSLNNYLDSILERKKLLSSFSKPENKYTVEYYIPNQIDNIKNNIIAFGITKAKQLFYRYINNYGFIVESYSTETINNTGYTIISITYEPEVNITSPTDLMCFPQRKGNLCFYVNGRLFWIIKNFPEFYFRGFNNDKEKQINVPYTISWGGGSFGLKHSYHYDFQKYILYKNENINYVQNNFAVRDIDDLNNVDGLSLDVNSAVFGDNVMWIRFTGNTQNKNKQFFVKFLRPISVLSNREYKINLSIYNNNFFNVVNANGEPVENKITLFLYGSVDINIIKEREYKFPLTTNDYLRITELNEMGLYPFDPDRQEYIYIRDNGLMYYGVSGEQIINLNSIIYNNTLPTQTINKYSEISSGVNCWLPLETVFTIQENTGKQTVFMGFLIETTDTFNPNGNLYVSGFTYSGADILVKDDRKDGLLIEQNFNDSFIGGIQKLRIYDTALNSSEILHNALMEMKKFPELNLRVSKGGRVIYI